MNLSSSTTHQPIQYNVNPIPPPPHKCTRLNSCPTSLLSCSPLVCVVHLCKCRKLTVIRFRLHWMLFKVVINRKMRTTVLHSSTPSYMYVMIKILYRLFQALPKGSCNLSVLLSSDLMSYCDWRCFPTRYIIMFISNTYCYLTFKKFINVFSINSFIVDDIPRYVIDRWRSIT